MKKILKNISIYLAIFIVLFITGIAISDIIIIARAKHILALTSTLPFEKDMQKAYPVLSDDKNGLYIINKVYKEKRPF